MQEERKLYIVVSQTGTALSRILKVLTGAKYNHASLSLEESLVPMYSFGRKYPCNPFWGAFVREYPDKGTFGRFRNTEAQVLALPCTQAQYDAIRERIEKMWREREKYHYNYGGLFLAYFSKKHRRKHHYYCSEFVREILERSGVIPPGTFGEIVKPIDFLGLPGAKLIYCGKLRKYRPASRQPALPDAEARTEERAPLTAADVFAASSVRIAREAAIADAAPQADGGEGAGER